MSPLPSAPRPASGVINRLISAEAGVKAQPQRVNCILCMRQITVGQICEASTFIRSYLRDPRSALTPSSTSRTASPSTDAPSPAQSPPAAPAQICALHLRQEKNITDGTSCQPIVNPNFGPPCIEVFSNQQWQWCSPTGNKSTGTVGYDSVGSGIISIDGNIIGMALGTISLP